MRYLLLIVALCITHSLAVAGQTYTLTPSQAGITLGPCPNPALVNENIAVSFSVQVGDPTTNVEGTLHKSTSWWVEGLGLSATGSTDGYTSGGVSATPSSGSGLSGSLNVKATTPGWWIGTIAVYLYYWDDGGNIWILQNDQPVRISMSGVAGIWQTATPVRTPEPLVPNDDVSDQVNTAPGYTYLWKSHHRSPNWCKAWAKGECVDSYDCAGWGDASGAATHWTLAYNWVPNAAPAVRYSFREVCEVKFTWTAQGDLHNYRPFVTTTGYSKASASAKISVVPGTSQDWTSDLSVDYHDSSSGAGLKCGVGVNIMGTPSVSLSLDPSPTWEEMNRIKTGVISGNIDSNGAKIVSTDVLLDAHASIMWSGNAVGPFEALGQVEILSHVLTQTTRLE